MLKFSVKDTDGEARAGILEMSRSAIETPAFMPCATHAVVRAVRWNEIHDIGYELILMNALHMYLRPGIDTVKHFGGLHRFSTWNKSILTDSGGYQFFSLKGLYKIDDSGVELQSPYDGSKHHFSPEKVVDIQVALGSDICMPLDECAPGNSERHKFVQAGERTIEWLKQAVRYFHSVASEVQSLFGIVQGGMEKDLRAEYAERCAELNLAGYAVGGISVGEDRELGDEIVMFTAPLLPADKPRYLMGVGLPEQILEAIESGIDMFDCVLPTRMARNGTLFTSMGRLNLGNSKFRDDDKPIDEKCDCEVCRKFSRSYLAHLYRVGDAGVLGLLSVHNLSFYKRLVRESREAILEKRLNQYKSDSIERWKEGN